MIHFIIGKSLPTYHLQVASGINHHIVISEVDPKENIAKNFVVIFLRFHR
jgi:hypothetical protein